MAMPIKAVMIFPILIITGNIINISYELYPVTGLVLTGYIIINQNKK